MKALVLSNKYQFHSFKVGSIIEVDRRPVYYSEGKKPVFLAFGLNDQDNHIDGKIYDNEFEIIL